MSPPFSPSRPEHAISAETWSHLGDLNPSAVSDILDARGFHRQVMRADVQALGEGMRLAGLARTLASGPATAAPEPGREYELLFGAIDGLRPGEVLVTDRTDCCTWGELCAEGAIRRGGNGAVIDGYTRDSADIRSIGFPMFCRGTHMSDLLYLRTITALDTAVLCGDVLVHPGDLVLGGADGVVVVPAASIEDVIGEAYEKSQTESKVRAALRDGLSVSDAYRRFGVM
jgi:regulator of RNase E activity RraA